MRDLSGRLARLEQFVAEGRISVAYALERAVALAKEDERDLRTEYVVDVAAAAREQEQSRCAGIVGGIAERIALGTLLGSQVRAGASVYIDPTSMATEILREIRDPLAQAFDLSDVPELGEPVHSPDNCPSCAASEPYADTGDNGAEEWDSSSRESGR